MENSDLINIAAKARALAYAPYSKFAVAAAIVTKSGTIFTDCNIENVSLGLTVCAQRSAGIAQGSRDLVAAGIVTDSTKPAGPCGACRQVLAEFNPNMKAFAARLGRNVQEFDLAELLPLPGQGVLEGTSRV